MTATAREQFLAERRTGIGGSDVAAILGVHPNRTPLDVWRDKVLGADNTEVAAMRRGSFLEAAIVSRYEAEVKPQSLVRSVSMADGWRRANIDALTERSIVEAKSVTKRVFAEDWGEPGTDDVPDKILCQGLWYVSVAGVDSVDFPVVVIPDDPDEVMGLSAADIVAKSDFHIFTVGRDKSVECKLVDACRSFWFDHVLPQVPPDPITLADAKHRWRYEIAGKSIVSDAAAISLLEQREARRLQIKQLEDEQEKGDFMLRCLMGDAECIADADTGNPLFTLKLQRRAGYVVEPTEFRAARFTKWWTRRQIAAAKEQP